MIRHPTTIAARTFRFVVALSCAVLTGPPSVARSQPAQTPGAPANSDSNQPAADRSSSNVERIQRIVGLLPADTWAALVVPSLADFDHAFGLTARAVELPPTFWSPVMLAKGVTGLFQGLPDDGSCALAFLAPKPDTTPGQSLVLLFSATDYDVLRTALRAEPHNEKISRVSWAGYASFMAQKDGFALFAQSPETLSRVLDAPKQHKPLPAAESAALSAGHAGLFVDAKSVVGSDPPDAFAALLTLTAEQVATLRAVDSLVVTVSFDAHDVTLDARLQVDDASDLARFIATASTLDPAVASFAPDPPVTLLAAAVARSETRSARQARTVRDWLAGALLAPQPARQPARQPGRKPGAENPAVERFTAAVVDIVRNTRDFSLSLATDPDTPANCLTLAARTAPDRAPSIADAFILAVQSAKEGFPANSASRPAEVLPYIQVTPDADRIGDAVIHHIQMNLPDDVEPSVRARIERFFGEPFGRIRFTAAAPDLLLLTIGGGDAPFRDALSRCRPLGQPPTAPDGSKPDQQTAQAQNEAQPTDPAGQPHAGPSESTTTGDAGPPSSTRLPARSDRRLVARVRVDLPAYFEWVDRLGQAFVAPPAPSRSAQPDPASTDDHTDVADVTFSLIRDDQFDVAARLTCSTRALAYLDRRRRTQATDAESAETITLDAAPETPAAQPPPE